MQSCSKMQGRKSKFATRAWFYDNSRGTKYNLILTTFPGHGSGKMSRGGGVPHLHFNVPIPTMNKVLCLHLWAWFRVAARHMDVA
jgi:hypothetical protein